MPRDEANKKEARHSLPPSGGKLKPAAHAGDMKVTTVVIIL